MCMFSPKKSDKHAVHNSYASFILIPPNYRTDTRELLGSALCVFNSNQGFIIENILILDKSNTNNWDDLTDLDAGRLSKRIINIISAQAGEEIELLFSKIVQMRNRIIHSFRITNTAGEQSLATKEHENKGGKQFEITEDYLMDFISMNEKLSDMLYKLRGY